MSAPRSGTSASLGFEHVWKPATDSRAPTLLLLHGTGGDEHDLLPVGSVLAPGAAVLSPRGKVLENGAPRFFRRHAEGVLDVDDLKARAVELAEFLVRAAESYRFDATRVFAFGYSNGANVAQGMLFERPRALAGAMLARPMPAYEPAPARTLEGRPVLVLAGRRDPYSGPPASDRLRDLLAARGARVEVRVEESGHELTRGDLDAARAWLAREASA